MSPGPTFAAVSSLSGQRQGGLVVFRAKAYPSQPLGPVTFLWRPRAQGSSHRQLWIWAHPTMKQVLRIFPSEELNTQPCGKSLFQVYLLLRTCYNSLPRFMQDLLPELRAVCQCSEALYPPALPVGLPAEVPTHGVEPESERSSEVEQVTGTKRRRTGADASAPPAKKILGDGTRSPTAPVTWRSSTTGIVIK